jgi:DNA-binding NarL/FixJ family response regulator
MFITETNVLAVGIRDKSSALQELPIRLLVMDTTVEALFCLRQEKIHTVISRWELVDGPAGEFLKRIREAKPAIPTIAFIKPGNDKQEIAARGLGVSIVLPENIDDDHFREAVCQLLGLEAITCIKESPCSEGAGLPEEDAELSVRNNAVLISSPPLSWV